MQFLRPITLLLISFALCSCGSGGGGGSEQVITGRLQIYQRDFGSNNSREYLLQTSATKRLRVNFRSAISDSIHSGAVVRLRGAVSESTLESDGAEVLGAIQGKSIAPLGGRAVAVLLLQFSDATVPCAAASISSEVFNGPHSVDALYREASFGQAFLIPDLNGDGRPDVFGPLSIAASRLGACDYHGWAALGDEAAKAAGIPLERYEHVVYVLPAGVQCEWGGMASVGCSAGECRVWVNGQFCGVGDIYAHELAHNLGLSHAAVDGDNDGTPESEYNDLSCPMGLAGVGARHFNAPHKHQLGWLPPQNLLTPAGSGTYTIQAMEAAAGGTQALVIPRPSRGDQLYISYRAPIGAQSTGLRPEYQLRTNIHAFSGAGLTRFIASIQTGESFTDPSTGISLTQQAASDSSATVQLAMPSGCIAQAPKVEISPTQLNANNRHAPAEATVRITNIDSKCGAKTISVKALGSERVSLSRDTVRLGEGESAAVSVALAPPELPLDGATSVAIEVGDSPERLVRAELPYLLDTTPPEAVIDLTATLERRGRVRVEWRVPLDAGSGAKSYRVYRDGAPLGSTLNTYFADRAATDGRHRYEVEAIDGAGNVSPRSQAVEIGG